MRYVLGPALVLIGLACIGHRSQIASAQQNSALPFRDLRQGAAWFRALQVKQVVVGAVFIAFGVLTLTGLFST